MHGLRGNERLLLGQIASAGRSEVEPATSLTDLGLIGNLHTAALVDRDGTIAWACLPRFASPSVFASLLDPERGGFARVAPEPAVRGDQRYLPSTNLLETRFTLPDGGRLHLIDLFLLDPDRESSPSILRLLESEGSTVAVTVTFAPRFGYGARVPALATRGREVIATDGDDRLVQTAPWPSERQGDRAIARGRVAPGTAQWVHLGFNGARPPRDPVGAAANAVAFWRTWVHGAAAPIHRLAGAWHTAVERSELVLKLLSHADTGAFVAAPTTSLPEWPGGGRNWDYRYVWIRDAAFAAQAMLLLDHRSEAAAFLGWVVDRIEAAPDGPAGLRVVYGAHGESDLTEREIPGLRGYLDSRPVRVGNGAAAQFQLDIFGELLACARLMVDLDPIALSRRWRRLVPLADRVATAWRRPDRGIWEVRGPPRHFVHSKLMAWVALDAAAGIADRYGDSAAARGWRRTADRIHATILRRGWDPDRRTFVRSFGEHAVDAANLRIPLVGFLPFDDPKVLATIDRVASDLAVGPFVYRYRADDGLAGPEGAFLPCSFWLVEARARAGAERLARKSFDRLLRAGGTLGLFSEEYDPVRRRPLGNYPQALTHIALLRAALALGYASAPAILRRELTRVWPGAGPAGPARPMGRG